LLSFLILPDSPRVTEKECILLPVFFIQPSILSPQRFMICAGIIEGSFEGGLDLLTGDRCSGRVLHGLANSRSLLLAMLLLVRTSKHLRLQMRGLLLRRGHLLRGLLLLRRRLLTPLSLALLDRRRVLTRNLTPRPQPLKD